MTSSSAGRAIAQPMDPALVEMLYHHLTMERNASAQYFAISIWFLERDLRGFSDYFKKESLSEHEHSSKFANYLVARGQTVVLHDLAAPKQEWESIEEVISDSFQLESDVTTSVQQIYSTAERSSDTRTNVFLDPIIDNQTKSEDDFAYLLSRVKLANNEASAILIIDGELS
ncbi:ferritin family protein [Prochlorococcus sp. SS52]|nr:MULTISPECIES: ferritin [Prochlorococcus]KGG11726.1 ferritin family protein [Prochlorococcus marinus str. LG]KGG18860.1 ferritin family protein [Prochlorococcus marinus str. SS2]KGG23602.1 ferritin family protein [Prochlorococcus marinus str. SS35]KGG32162.1 ferritin family protein [Prochlorococcus marinus str. SS51]KGG35147.1 ferritin family protein [Prochlorococcus sp. SS52]